MSGLFPSVSAILAVLGSVFLVVFWAFFKGRQSGTEANARETLDAIKKGRKAVAQGEASGETPDERVRRNDGAWQ